MPKQITGPLEIALAKPTNADWSSQEFPASQIDLATFIISTAGITTSSGEFKVVAKNHEDGNWSDLPLTPLFLLGNTNFTKPILVTELCFTKIRLDFIAGAPTDDGTFSVWMQGEGLV